MLTFLVYLWLKLDTVVSGILAMTVAYFIGLAVYGLISLSVNDIYRTDLTRSRLEKYKQNFKKRIIICASAFLIVGAIPNSNQVAVLAATHYTQELIQSEEGQKIVQLVRKKASKYLDEQLKELDEGVVNKTQQVVDVVKK